MDKKKLCQVVAWAMFVIAAIALLSITLLFRDNSVEDKFTFPDKLGAEWLHEIDSTKAGSVVIPGQRNMVIIDGNKIPDTNFCNPIQNEELYLMMFALVLEEDENKALYVSEPIFPGECVNGIIINRNIDDMQSKAKVLIQPYRMDSGTKTNGASASVWLNRE